MFNFTIRDVLWLTVVVALSVCLWSDRSSLVRLRVVSQSDKQELQKQRDALASLIRENAENAGRVKRLVECLYEAEPGVFYLGPRSDAMSRYNETILGRSAPP